MLKRLSSTLFQIKDSTIIDSAFVEAVVHSDFQKCKEFFARGMKIDTPFGCFAPNDYTKSTTPLEYAVKSKKVELVRFLLKNGANPQSNGRILLHACRNHQIDIVNLLLNAGAKPNFKLSSKKLDGFTAMHALFLTFEKKSLSAEQHNHKKNSAINIATQLIKAGYRGNLDDLKAYFEKQKAPYLFPALEEIWPSLNDCIAARDALLKTYTVNATIGFFQSGLPPEISAEIASYLDLKDGNALAQTSKSVYEFVKQQMTDSDKDEAMEDCATSNGLGL